MTYCVMCGAQVEDGIGICPQCGAVVPGAFDTPDPQTSGGGRDMYSDPTYGNQEPYQEQAYGNQEPYNGQTYGGQDSYNGQAYGGQEPYNGQAYGSQEPYNGQAYGSQEPYDGQVYGNQEPYHGQTYGNQGSYNGQTYGNQDTYSGQTYGNQDAYDYDPDYFPQQEVKANKVMGILSYLGIFVLIPAIAGDKNSDYLKQHINQGLALFVMETILNVVERIEDHIIFINRILSGVIDIAGFAFFILAVMGIVSAAKGTRKLLPTIGNIKIFR